MPEMLQHDEFISCFFQTLEINPIDGLTADHSLAEAFYALTERMLAVNEQMNLTTIKTVPEIILRHYVDSLTVLPYLPAGAKVLDIGCGAGFPCLPLALARPDLDITAVDSTEKKARYVAETARLLGISPARFHTLALRAEEGGAVGGQLREKFNIVVSRAVAHLGVLGELSLPCLQVGGRLIALKGAKATQEIAEARGLGKLGAAPAQLIPCPITPLQGEAEQHALVIIDKMSPTPNNFPRKYAQMVKKPL